MRRCLPVPGLTEKNDNGVRTSTKLKEGDILQCQKKTNILHLIRKIDGSFKPLYWLDDDKEPVLPNLIANERSFYELAAIIASMTGLEAEVMKLDEVWNSYDWAIRFVESGRR